MFQFVSHLMGQSGTIRNIRAILMDRRIFSKVGRFQNILFRVPVVPFCSKSEQKTDT